MTDKQAKTLALKKLKPFDTELTFRGLEQVAEAMAQDIMEHQIMDIYSALGIPPQFLVPDEKPTAEEIRQVTRAVYGTRLPTPPIPMVIAG